MLIASSSGPDGVTLASGSSDDTVRVWDGRYRTDPENSYRASRVYIYRVAFSPDGGTLAGATLLEIFLWDPATGLRKQMLTSEDDIRSIAFSPDGSTLASGSRDTSICLWDVMTEASGSKHSQDMDAGLIASLSV